jgi:FkbM family methyltransferase
MEQDQDQGQDQDQEQTRPKMCLNMIVKNESHIVKQTLEKLIKKINIDYYVISDTGSTDNTKEIITNFFKRNNIPGEIYDDNWQDFAHNRTKALEHAYNKSDYLLIFDADDEISGDFKLPENISNNDAYYLKFGKHTAYRRILIVNNKKKWRYESVLHEYICNCEPINDIADIEGDYYVLERRAGNRSLQADKYLKDALILENAHKIAKESNDPIMLRYAYYCANSYRDAHMSTEAIKWYKITLSQDNWAQEKYVSCLNLYELYEKIDSKETGFYYLVESFKYDTQRAECLDKLIEYYCNNKMNQMAFNYYLIIKSFFENEYFNSHKSTLLKDKLFVNISILDLKLPYMMILVSDRIQQFATTYKMYEIIFTKKYETHEEHYIGNMLYNLKFFIDGAIKANTDNFMNLFQSYLDFLIEIKYPLWKHKFLEDFEKYGLNLYNIFQNKRIFTEEECKKSNKILLYTGYASVRWNYSYSMNNPLGGSETAAASLSKNFPQNWSVYVAGNQEEETIGNVTYVHLDNIKKLIESNAFHTIIVSRYLNFYEHYTNFSAYKTYIWAHDIHLLDYGTNLSAGDIITKWSSNITGCICQTEWHKNRYLDLYPQLKDKIQIINNGINEKMFSNLEPPQPLEQSLKQSIQKKNNRFIYTSCSERGLVKLIELWPSILENLPDAELFFSSYKPLSTSEEDTSIMEFIKNNSSVKYVGTLNRKDLYELMATAEYWLYPTNFEETSCITSLEMLASEVICLYYPHAGLVDTLGSYGIQISDGNEIDTLLNLSDEQKTKLKKEGKEYALSCSWKNRAKEWAELLRVDDDNIKMRITELHNIGCIPKNHVDFLKQLSIDFKPTVVYDIGANVLHWTREARKIWPKSEIIAFDAMQTAEFLYKEHNVKYHIGVLSDTDNAIVKFYENIEHPAGNSYYKEIGHQLSSEIYPEDKYTEQTAMSLKSVVKQKQFPLPDLVKMDVQGAELDILRGGIEVINKAKYLIVELQDVQYNRGAPLADQTIDYLTQNGWDLIARKFSDNGPDGDYCFVNTKYTKQKWVFYYQLFITKTITQYIQNYNNDKREVYLTNDKQLIRELQPDKMIMLLNNWIYNSYDCVPDISAFNEFENTEICFLQLEPLNIPHRLECIKRMPPEYLKYKIYDYSLSNIKLLNENGITNCEHLPYIVTDSEKRISNANK